MPLSTVTGLYARRIRKIRPKTEGITWPEGPQLSACADRQGKWWILSPACLSHANHYLHESSWNHNFTRRRRNTIPPLGEKVTENDAYTKYSQVLRVLDRTRLGRPSRCAHTDMSSVLGKTLARLGSAEETLVRLGVLVVTHQNYSPSNRDEKMEKGC